VNDDRVSELYLGQAELASSMSHIPCRARIDWMVSEVRGRTVDIGSSQGIVSILLGRAGLDVTGVEIEEPAIAYAKRALAAEPAEVQRRVAFIQADIYGHIANQKFDTVVLGEILEHHDAPRRLWLRAAELVAPKGRIVGTTPFGLHPHPDHKVTFYLRSFIDTIAGVGTLTYLDIQDGFIRFIVSMDPAAVPVATDAEALLALSEQGFLAIQLGVEGERARHKTRADAVTALNEKAKALSQKLEQTRADHVATRAELNATRAERDAAKSRLSKLEDMTNPPEDATPRVRGLSAFLSSLLREVNTGGMFESPLQAMRKTYARVRRAANHELSSGE
jgi:SAM-dependent methyltransferase